MAPATTNWPAVALVILAGIATALQVGKLPVAMPALQAEMGLSLVTLSWIFAIFSLLTASLGAVFGSVTRRLGLYRVAMAGLLIGVLGNLIGAFASGVALLLATRVLEGLGFLLIITSLPPLIMQLAAENDRRSAMAFWSLFLPTGSFIAMLMSGPILEAGSWRVLWVVIATCMLASLVSLAWLRRRQGPPTAKPAPLSAPDLLRLLRDPGRLVASLTFGVYAAQYMIVTGFIALILTDTFGLSAVQVGIAVAAVVGVNSAANALAGLSFRRGWRSSTLILWAGLVLMVAHLLIFALPVSPLVQVLGMLLFGMFSGLVPASLFASLPRLAPNPEAVPIMSGLLMQGSAIGQLIGPPAAAAMVGLVGGWMGAALVLLVLALTMLAGGLYLRRSGG